MKNQTKQSTTIEFDNPLLGKGKIESGNIYIVWVGMLLVFGLIFFFIYLKYGHKKVMIKWRNRKRKKR